MEETSYKATMARILSESFFVWLFLTILIVGNIYLIDTYKQLHSSTVLGPLILGNIVFGLQTIGGIVAFINYRKYSVNRTVVITSEEIRLHNAQTNQFIEMKTQIS